MNIKFTLIILFVLVTSVSCKQELDIEDVEWYHKDKGNELSSARIGQGVPFSEGKEYTGNIVIKNSEEIVTGRFPYENGQLSGELEMFDDAGNITSAIELKNDKVTHSKIYTADYHRNLDNGELNNEIVLEVKYNFLDDANKKIDMKAYLGGELVVSQTTYDNIAIGDIFYLSRNGSSNEYTDEYSISGFRKEPDNSRRRPRINFGNNFRGRFLNTLTSRLDKEVPKYLAYRSYRLDIDGEVINFSNWIDYDMNSNNDSVLHGNVKKEYYDPVSFFDRGYEPIDTKSRYFKQFSDNYSKETPIKIIEATFDEGLPTSLKVINTEGQIIYSNEYEWEVNGWGNSKRLVGTR